MNNNEKELDFKYAGQIVRAIRNNDAVKAKELLDGHLEYLRYDKKSKGTFIYIAAGEGAIECMKYLLSIGEDINRKSLAYGKYALTKAAFSNQPEMLKFLLDNGARMDISSAETNPLFSAIYKRSVECVKILLDAGIDVTVKYEDGPGDAYRYARNNSSMEIVLLIQDKLKELGIEVKNEIKKERHIEMKEDDGSKVINHIEKYLGSFNGCISEVVPGSKVSIDINIINPASERNYITLVTTGMSEYPMAYTSGEYKYAELIIKLPTDWKLDQESCKDEENYWPIRMLRLLGHLPHLNPGYINEQVIVPHGEPDDAPYPFTERTWLSSLMLCKAEDIPPYVFEDGTKIDFFTLVPITIDEEPLVKEKGSNEVMHMLKSKDVVDLSREYLVEEEW